MVKLFKLRLKAYISLFIWSTLLSFITIALLVSTDSLAKVKSLVTNCNSNTTFYSYILDPSDLGQILTTIKSVEENYNKYWNYDWTLVYYDNNYSEKTVLNLNSNLEKLLSNEIKGELIIKTLNANNQPDWFNLKEFEAENLSETQLSKVLKNRFNAFGMFELEALDAYDYAINVEIGSTLNYKLKGDIICFMQKNKISVAFIDTIKINSEDTLIKLFDTSISTLNLELLKFDDLNSFGLIDSNFQFMNLNSFHTFEYLNLKRQFNNKLIKNGWSDYIIKTIYILNFIHPDNILWLNYSGLNSKYDSTSSTFP